MNSFMSLLCFKLILCVFFTSCRTKISAQLASFHSIQSQLWWSLMFTFMIHKEWQQAYIIVIFIWRHTECYNRQTKFCLIVAKHMNRTFTKKETDQIFSIPDEQLLYWFVQPTLKYLQLFLLGSLTLSSLLRNFRKKFDCEPFMVDGPKELK